MIWGIIILTSIFIISIFIFIELLRARFQIRQGINFSSAFSHELMTPLTCINMNLETLLFRKNMAQDKQEKLLQAAFSESEKLENSIKKIFALKRIDFAKKRIGHSTVYINDYIFKIVSKAKKRYPSVKITFESQIKTPTYLSIEEKFFQLVFDNIIENAIKYTKVSPKVSISLRANKKFCIISISDNGIGMNKTTQKKVFKPFYRGNKNIRGNGIGLHIVKEILKLHKAKIYVKSEGENKGSTFVIKIHSEKIKGR